MAAYVFGCCGRVVIFPDDFSPSLTTLHLCIGDIPCIGAATLVGSPAISLVQTEAVDPVSVVVVGTDGGNPNNGDGQ